MYVLYSSTHLRLQTAFIITFITTPAVSNYKAML